MDMGRERLGGRDWWWRLCFWHVDFGEHVGSPAEHGWVNLILLASTFRHGGERKENGGRLSTHAAAHESNVVCCGEQLLAGQQVGLWSSGSYCAQGTPISMRGTGRQGQSESVAGL